METTLTQAELQRRRHDDLVQFLRDQQTLGDPVIYEPVIMIRRERITIGQGTRIDGFVKLEGGEGMAIGRYVHIASFAHIGIGGGTTTIEDFAAVSSGGRVISGSNIPDAPSGSAVAPPQMIHIERKFVKLCRFTIVFAGGIVLPGVTLHEGAILAAGGVATKDIPPWEIWGGTPARFLKRRVISEEYKTWLHL